MPRNFRWVCASLGLLLAGPAAAAPEWASLRDLETVEVVTTDEDGAARETTVWLVVVDGAGYVRTGDTRWGGDLARKPELELVAAGVSHPMRVEFVEDDALRQRIADAFGAKYGLTDRLLSWVRGSRPRIMQLHPRE